MIDTQKIQSAPRCISGIAEVAATLARLHADHCTHAIEVTTCFPLDVETIGRVLEGLDDRPGIDLVRSDGITYLYIARPDDYNLRQLELDHGEHLNSNASLIKHLSEFRSDPEWVKKVHEQHEILRIASAARGKTRRLELNYFTSRSELPSARIQSALNDLSASGHVLTELTDNAQVAHYVFPEFDYPKARYFHNMNLLDTLQPAQERSNARVLLAALLVTMLLVAVAVATMM